MEYVRFQHLAEDHQFSPRYGALVVNRSGKWHWVELGPAGEVAAALDGLDELLRARLTPTDADFTSAARRVERELWEPLRRLLEPETAEVVIAPDAKINLLSFAILWQDGAFLGEPLRFRYVTSGRRLVAPPHAGPHSKLGVIVAAPDFDGSVLQESVIDPLRKLGGRALEWLGMRGSKCLPESYPLLPGTMKEGEQLEHIWSQKGLSEVRLLRASAAKKDAVLAVQRPRLLHIATHGQYVEGDAFPPNPMLRCWLALAGADRTLARLRSGTFVEVGDDGILRADEIRSMDLHQTQLVALSACDSGIGAIRSGEGIFGLRRAFHEAGVRNLFLTLWPVQDSRTAEFVPEFYRHLLGGADPVDALHVVQASRLEEFRATAGPAAAARLFGPFVISA